MKDSDGMTSNSHYIIDESKSSVTPQVANYGLGDERRLWKHFVAPVFEKGAELFVQPHLTGKQYVLWKSDQNCELYNLTGTEIVKEYDQADDTGLMLQKLDCQKCLLRVTLQEVKDKQCPETNIIIDDIYYLDGDMLIDQPYVKRYEQVLDVAGSISSWDHHIIPHPTKTFKEQTPLEEVGAALDWATDWTKFQHLRSEGALLKDGSTTIANSGSEEQSVEYQPDNTGSVELPTQFILVKELSDEDMIANHLGEILHNQRSEGYENNAM